MGKPGRLIKKGIFIAQFAEKMWATVPSSTSLPSVKCIIV